MEFDIGYTRRDTMQIKAAKNDLTVYIITGENEKDIVKQFRGIIGRSYIPPLWAFGYGQSRWGYKNEADIREVAAKYKAAWTASIWTSTTWSATRTSPWMKSVSRI
jgi:alpha-glucosidase